MRFQRRRLFWNWPTKIGEGGHVFNRPGELKNKIGEGGHVFDRPRELKNKILAPFMSKNGNSLQNNRYVFFWKGIYLRNTFINHIKNRWLMNYLYPFIR